MDREFPKSSNSAVKRSARQANQNQRFFGGKLTGFENNRERHFYQRMLRAYINGDTNFQFGKTELTNEAKWFQVQLTDKTHNQYLVDQLLSKSKTNPGKVFGGVNIGKSELRKKVWEMILARIEEEKPKFPKKGFIKKVKEIAQSL